MKAETLIRVSKIWLFIPIVAAVMLLINSRTGYGAIGPVLWLLLSFLFGYALVCKKLMLAQIICYCICIYFLVGFIFWCIALSHFLDISPQLGKVLLAVLFSTPFLIMTLPPYLLGLKGLKQLAREIND